MTTRVGEQKYGRNIRDGILRRNVGRFGGIPPDQVVTEGDGFVRYGTGRKRYAGFLDNDII